MDEASQSLLSMVCASKLLGKHIIWIGDSMQLSPIVELNLDIIKKRNYGLFINGMVTILNNLSIPSFHLTNSYRLTKRSVAYTGIFYNNSLISKSPSDYKLKYLDLNEEVRRFLNPNSGPTLIKTKMPVGESCPEFATHLLINIVYHLLKGNNSKLEIAVLTKLKKTVKKIQKDTAIKLGTNKNIIIETVERVQGLTTDITIFFIPNSMMDLSLNRAIFNVATSRAKGQTIIIADENILEYPFMCKEVKKYLNKLNKEYSFVINPSSNSQLQIL
jgi:DNA replication ATP-dependent helicase Dna2|tara:strand:- start:1904 stop:2725 length:822 start_codon:yes stop_codon:yes gene_type:complete